MLFQAFSVDIKQKNCRKTINLTVFCKHKLECLVWVKYEIRKLLILVRTAFFISFAYLDGAIFKNRKCC